MDRLEGLREYRSRLTNDLNQKVDKFFSDGRPVEQALPLSEYMATVQSRVRLINAEVDKLVASK